MISVSKYLDIEFFNIVDHTDQITSNWNLYDGMPVNVKRNSRTQITNLRKLIDDGNYSFKLDHAAYVLMKREVDWDRDEAKKGRTHGFTKFYKKYVSSIVDHAIRKLDRDLYQQSTFDEDAAEEPDDDQNPESTPLQSHSSLANRESLEELPLPANDFSDEDEPSASESEYDEESIDDNEDICVAIGDVSTTVAFDAVMKEAAKSKKDQSIRVEYNNPRQNLIAVNCSHPLRLTFEGSLFDQYSFDPTHITCIVGLMPLYAEVILMVRCSRFKDLRTITFLEPYKLKIPHSDYTELNLFNNSL